MSLLDNASLLLTPNAYKASKLYSVIPDNGNGDFTATRATTATRINSSGLVESVALNIPRVDYSLGGCPNILLEPQRTNLVLQSSSFDNASWSKTASSVTANATTSPSGIADADTLTADGTLNTHITTQSVSVTSGANYTLSFYAKKNTNNFIQIIGGTAGFGVNSWANFDLNAGVVGSVGSSTTASIQSIGNGWYRCVVTIAATATTGGIYILNLITSATSPRLEVNTLNTSVFLWGAQIEAGAYATSYIPTTTASVTRNADSITRNNIFTNGLITAAGGTWFVELRNNRNLLRDSIANNNTLFISDSSVLFTTNSICIHNPTNVSAFLSVFLRNNGSSQTIYTTNAANIKLAIKWNGATMDVFQNGVKVVSAHPFAATNLNFLNGGGGDVPKYLNEMALFPTPLTDAQCIALTQ